MKLARRTLAISTIGIILIILLVLALGGGGYAGGGYYYGPGGLLLLVLIILLFTVIEIPAMVMVGLWFALQAVFGAAGLTDPTGGGGAVAYFTSVGGFVFGLLAIRAVATRRKAVPPTAAAYR